jgi:coenzyme F420-reducing hydrogenase beta subunit
MIGYKKENIILLDIFCGRINSNKLIEKYVSENSFDDLAIEFRNKSSSWYHFSISLKNKYKEKKELFRESLFGQFLNSKLMTQDACYDCIVGSAGVADITLGDFWNEKKYGYEKDGVSIIVTRTELGEKVIHTLDNVYLKEEPTSELTITQPHFFTKEKNKQYLKETNLKVLSDMHNMSLQELSDKYIYNTLKKKMKRNIRKLVGIIK